MLGRVRLAILAWVMLALVAPCDGAAATIVADLVADYTPGVNPGDTVTPPATGSGQWRYLASDTLNPTDGGANVADLEWDTTGQLFERPGQNHTDGFREDVLRLGANVLFMHPANFAGDVVLARWIAGPGEAGAVDIIGNVAKGDPGGGDGVRFLVFVDGVPLFDEVVAFDDTVGIPIALQSVAIAEGSTTDFVVSKIGDAFFDTTKVTAVITLTTGPTTTSSTSTTTTSSTTTLLLSTTTTTTTTTSVPSTSTTTLPSTTTTSVAPSTTTTTLPGAARFPDGQKLLVTRRKSGEHRFQLIGKGLEIQPAAPCETNGLLIIAAAGVGTAPAVFPLDAALWQPINAKKPERGCKYRKGPAVALVQIKTGTSLTVIGGAADVGIPLGADPRPVRVELRHGEVRHCFEFGPGTKADFKAEKKLLAKRAGRATECPGPVTSPGGRFVR